MTYARMINQKFKPGKREEALKIIDRAQKEDVKGFKGIIALLHEDDPDSATVISLWDSEDTLRSSAEGIFHDLMDETEGLRAGPPEIINGKIREMRGQLVQVAI